MKTYIVKRHGSNAANQSMCNVRVVGTVSGVDAQDANINARELYTCYNNQFLELIDLAGRTRKDDRNAASEADAWRVDCIVL